MAGCISRLNNQRGSTLNSKKGSAKNQYFFFLFFFYPRFFSPLIRLFFCFYIFVLFEKKLAKILELIKSDKERKSDIDYLNKWL